MPLEPKLAPCGWRCPHRRPALTGSFGNYSDWWTPLFLDPSDGVFGRFDLAALAVAAP